MPRQTVGVYNLWLNPYMSDIQILRQDNPYVDYENMDYSKIVTFLRELFNLHYGRIQVVNECIDLVTTLRWLQTDERLLGCEKIGQELLKNHHKTKEDVIDVKDRWRKNYLHYPNRKKAPPPRALTFVVDAQDDFAELMIWEMKAHLSLGNNGFTHFSLIENPDPDRFKNDKINQETIEKLKILFNGTCYDESVTLARVATTEPLYVQRTRNNPDFS